MTTAATPRPRRADAERSIARIIRAARECLSQNPDTSVDDIARAAGVGRMTLYGHFATRADLIESALADALKSGEETLAAVDLGGDAGAALTRLLNSSWTLVAESNALLAAAKRVLSPERIWELHAGSATRMEGLISCGQRQGVFRTDLPVTWLVSVVHYIIKGAAEEVRAGGLDATAAAQIVTATVHSILAKPSATSVAQ